MPNDQTVTEAQTLPTPGPWEFEAAPASVVDDVDLQTRLDECPFWIAETDARGEVLALVLHTSLHNAEANARLFAAAPDLLQLVREGLQAFEEQHGPEPGHVLSVRDWMQSARRVLATIEGRS